MRRWFDITLILIFLSGMLTPLAVKILRLEGRKPTGENRSLAQIPPLPSTCKEVLAFPQGVDAYARDSFGLRNDLLYLDSWLKWKLTLRITEKVLVGKDGWLFLGKANNVVEQYRGVDLFSHSDLKQWVDAMVERQHWLEARGIYFIIVVPPTKHSIYPEFLPETIGPVVGKTPLDQLAAYIKQDTDLDFLDLRKTVLEARQSFRVFHKTDSHWNDMGGFAGYSELMKRVKKYFPKIKPLTLNDYVREEKIKPGGDLAKMLNLQDVMFDLSPVLTPRFPSRVCKQKVTGTKKDRSTHRIFYETNCPALPSVVIFHDSFIWGISKLLRENFNRTVLAHHCGLKFDTELIEKEQPGLVIYELAERAAKRRIADPFASCKKRPPKEPI